MPPHAKQYTIRNVPVELDRALRRRARTSGKSFNQVALEALAMGAGVERSRRDLSGIAGSMSGEEARELQDEIDRQHQIDADMWR